MVHGPAPRDPQAPGPGKLSALDELLRLCPWAVDADLLRMGIDIEAARRGEGPGPIRCASLILHQGPGAEVWKELGGEAAWSEEEYRLIELRHQQLVIAHAQSGQSGAAPKFPAPPIGRIKERENERTKVKRARTVGKAQAARLADPEYAAEMRRRMASWGDDWMVSEDQKKRVEAAQRMATW